jgi:acetylornithine deacetylase
MTDVVPGAAHPSTAADVQALLACVDAQRESAAELLGALIAVPSIGGTPAEVEVQHLVADLLRDSGMTVETWDIDVDAVTSDPQFPGQEVERAAAVGVLATTGRRSGGGSLLIDGHTDVVPPGDPDAWTGDPWAMRREDVGGVETLLGRGACDMKAGVIATVLAVRALRDAGIELGGELLVAPVIGEEDGGFGTFELVRRGVRADACIIPEPTDLDIVPANGGALTFRLRIPGQAVHASRRTEGVSAIEKFLPLFTAIHDFEAVRNASVHPYMQRWPLAYPVSIGTVQAGDWASTVPDLLVAEGRLGVALEETPEQARAAFEQAVAAAAAKDPFLRHNPVRVEWWGGQFAPGLSTDPGLLDLVSGAHTAAAPDAREQEVYGGPYGSDLRLLAPSMPTVQYGPGGAQHAHSPHEQVALDDIVVTARALALATLAHCGRA